VHPELRRELRTALFHALRIRKSVEVRKALREEDGEGQEPLLVNMVVRPFRDHDASADLVLVLFDAVDDTLGDTARPTDAGQEGVLGQLELELQRTRARLQATIEEAEISTEELKASNEELQAINEELRSATEELETSKEELQSLNEELITVNFELKAKVDEASRANDDLQNLIASTDIATIFIDAELRIKRYTPRAEDLFSLIPADIGRHLADISHRLDYPELSGDAVAAFESLQSRERAVLSAAGREYIARVLPYRTTENRIDGAVLTFIDVTDLRHAERRGSHAAEAGAETDADPHAADLVRDEFLAVMSHELKHPLNLMSVHVDRLSRAPEVRGAEATARVVEQLRRAVQGQRKIIDDLLDLSRLRTGKLSLNMAAVDLGALVHDIVAIARADASCARIDLQEAIEDGAMVMADPQRMEQVVWNLVGNAIKFTGEGRVTVRVETRDEEVRLSVQDDGPGIAAEFLPRVFDLFGQAAARAASRQAGLGIGLALSRQLVHSQGGRIQALSAGPGEGSTFTVWMPQMRELPRTVVPLDDSIPQAALSGWRILVVDDMADTVDALASLLALEGATVTTAGGGAEALALAAERDLDLLLSDTGMPGMDGNELVRRIRALPRHRQLPAIAISGFNSPRDVAKARAAGFNDHIGKPITFAGLIGAIRRLAHSAD
jgi:two-component system CheB/CheR fusion protein